MRGLFAYQTAVGMRDRVFTRMVAGSFAEVGHGTRLAMPIQVQGARLIVLGSDVYVGARTWLLALDPAARLEIGDGTILSGECVLSAAESVRIGRKVLFGRNVHVADHRHGISQPRVAVMDQPPEDRRPVSIGDGVWLGQNVLVLPGAEHRRGRGGRWQFGRARGRPAGCDRGRGPGACDRAAGLTGVRFHPTAVEGVWTIEAELLLDERGWFARTFDDEAFRAQGLDPTVVQCNASFNEREGTLRGLHYQAGPHGEPKLVRCVRGAIFDVAVDVRPDSPTLPALARRQS